MPALSLPLPRQLLAPFRGLPRSVYVQVLATLINNMGGSTKLFLPLYFLEHYRLGYTHIGLLMGVYGLGSFLGAYFGGSLSDRIAPHRLTQGLLAASGVFCLLLAMPLPLAVFPVLLLLAGLADGGFRPGNMRLVLEPCSPAQRPTAQGLQRMSTNLGGALGGISGGLLASVGFSWLFLAQGLTSLIGAAWMAYSYHRAAPPPRPQPIVHSSEAGRSAWLDRPFLLLVFGQLLALTVFDQIYGTLGLFLREHYHLGPQWLGYLFTLNCLMVVGLQLPIAHRVGRWGLTRSSHAGVICVGVSFLLLNLGNGVPWALASMAVLTMGELLVSPTWAAIVMRHSEGRRRGQYMGIYNAAWAGRTLFAPALGTWAYGQFGGPLLWWLCAGVAGLALLVHWPVLPRMLGRE
ncbi:MFS transporter [Neisseriaceae bacterium JH1-16]|nr:MFS transporter [Neisseriaceae bacterium JH1-16]